MGTVLSLCLLFLRHSLWGQQNRPPCLLYLKEDAMKRFRFVMLIGMLAMSLCACSMKDAVSYLDKKLVENSQYETTSIEDYGDYKGNFNNKTVKKFITLFFPQEIKPIYENINYIYRAEKFDTYAFEAWLEFEIRDEDAFQTYVDTVTKGERLQAFAYDNTYSEYVIAESFELHPNAQNDEDPSDGYSIQYAMIGKILINDEKNEIIYVALGVYDGGGVRTDYLREYFTRFNIDPLQYDQGSEAEFYIFPDER